MYRTGTLSAHIAVYDQMLPYGLFLAKTFLWSFDCNVESDFVPKFETVGDGLRGRIDPNCDALHLMFVDSIRD